MSAWFHPVGRALAHVNVKPVFKDNVRIAHLSDFLIFTLAPLYKSPFEIGWSCDCALRAAVVWLKGESRIVYGSDSRHESVTWALKTVETEIWDPHLFIPPF